jgi:hypothetical protein
MVPGYASQAPLQRVKYGLLRLVDLPRSRPFLTPSQRRNYGPSHHCLYPCIQICGSFAVKTGSGRDSVPGNNAGHVLTLINQSRIF